MTELGLLYGLPPTARAVYLSICSYVDEAWTCYPGVATLAKQCHTTTRTVERSIATLQDLELIAVIVRGGGRKRPNHYRVIDELTPGAIDRLKAKTTTKVEQRRRRPTRKKAIAVPQIGDSTGGINPDTDLEPKTPTLAAETPTTAQRNPDNGEPETPTQTDVRGTTYKQLNVTTQARGAAAEAEEERRKKAAAAAVAAVQHLLGKTVQHPNYGPGRVTRIDPAGEIAVLRVQFIKWGERSFGLTG